MRKQKELEEMRKQEVEKGLHVVYSMSGKDLKFLDLFIDEAIEFEEFELLDGGDTSTDKAKFLVKKWGDDSPTTEEIEDAAKEFDKFINEHEEPKIRTFDTGANRNSDKGKLDYEGFLSPIVLKAYAEYMDKMRYLENGEYRDSDNWQRGIPESAYMKSMWRHFMDVWSNHRCVDAREDMITSLCGLMFNVMGMLHENLKD